MAPLNKHAISSDQYERGLSSLRRNVANKPKHVTGRLPPRFNSLVPRISNPAAISNDYTSIAHSPSSKQCEKRANFMSSHLLRTNIAREGVFMNVYGRSFWKFVLARTDRPFFFKPYISTTIRVIIFKQKETDVHVSKFKLTKISKKLTEPSKHEIYLISEKFQHFFQLTDFFKLPIFKTI